MWILETERLALRQLTMNDVDSMLPIFSDPEAMRFYPAPFTRTLSYSTPDAQLSIGPLSPSASNA